MNITKTTLGKIKKEAKGFTIIELLIATAVFSVILLVATFAIVSVSQNYVRGFIDSETNNTTKSIMSDLTQSIELSNSVAPDAIVTPTQITAGPDASLGAPAYFFCINGTMYTYETYTSLTNSNNVFLEQPNSAGCTASSTPINLTQSPSSLGSNTKELLEGHMQVVNLQISPSTLGNNLYTVNLSVVYGDSSGSPAYNYTLGPNSLKEFKSCLSISIGGSFCSQASELSTVEQRL